MRAIIAEEAGGPNVLRFVERDAPAPGAGELLVESGAIGVNFIDTYKRSGHYPMSYPHVPGSEAAGRVIAVGDGVTDFVLGDRVLTAEGRETYAEQFVVPAAAAVKIPDALEGVLNDEMAAALPLQGITAHYLAVSAATPEPGDTVIVHAGAGGVGLLLTQLLASRGVRVITTASTSEKRELSREAGAFEVLDYAGFGDRARELTNGEGVAVVYDGVGKTTFEESLASLRVRGEMVLFGGASGPVPPFDLLRLSTAGSLSVTRPTMGHFLRTAEERAWRYRELFDAISTRTLNLRVGKTFALAEAAAAHEALESRASTGKIVLLPH